MPVRQYVCPFGTSSYFHDVCHACITFLKFNSSVSIFVKKVVDGSRSPYHALCAGQTEDDDAAVHQYEPGDQRWQGPPPGVLRSHLWEYSTERN